MSPLLYRWATLPESSLPLAIKDGQTKRDSFCSFQVFVFLVLKSLTKRQAIIYYEQVLSKLAGKISTRIASIALAVILALIPSLQALAQDSETITITMTTKTVIEIDLNPANWEIWQVVPNTEYKTDPAKTWCTMTNKGNCTVNTYIKGDDAVWTASPSAYKWTLSDNGSNGKQIYVLWYERLDYAPTEDLITTETKDFYLSLGMDDPKQFGLKLKTPWADYIKNNIGYFLGGGGMETHIIISGVAV